MENLQVFIYIYTHVAQEWVGQAELAFEDIAVAVQLPGHVISDTVSFLLGCAANLNLL